MPSRIQDDLDQLDTLLKIMAALRNPEEGCPWDLEQTFRSIAPYTLEEAYEVVDAIERGNLDDLKEGQAGAASNESPQTADGFDGQLDACIHHDAVDRLGQIQIPTLITIGLQDIFTPPAFSEILHQGIEGSQMITFPDGGHVHHWEDLERFNQVTTNFLLEN